MVGKWVSFWDGLFSGAMLVLRRVWYFTNLEFLESLGVPFPFQKKSTKVGVRKHTHVFGCCKLTCTYQSSTIWAIYKNSLTWIWPNEIIFYQPIGVSPEIAGSQFPYYSPPCSGVKTVMFSGRDQIWPFSECFGHFWGSGFPYTKKSPANFASGDSTGTPHRLPPVLTANCWKTKTLASGKNEEMDFFSGTPKKIQPGKPFVLYFWGNN